MSRNHHDTGDSWLIGESAVPRVAALADRFRSLLRHEAERELGHRVYRFAPWLAVRGRRSALSALMDLATNGAPPELLSDIDRLRVLDSGVRDSDNAVGAIVPADIRVRVDTAFVVGDFAFILAEAKRLIAQGQAPWIGALLTDIVSYVVPIVHRPEGAPVKRGFSTPLCYGAVFLTFEDRRGSPDVRATELAIDLAHEVGHHVLHTYQTADPILNSDLRAPVYSGVKKSERPAIMSVHASVALAYMIAASEAFILNDTLEPAAREMATVKRDAMIEQQRVALEQIRARVEPTALGELIIGEMERQVA